MAIISRYVSFEQCSIDVAAKSSRSAIVMSFTVATL